MADPWNPTGKIRNSDTQRAHAGAAMAVGVACAGTGMRAATDLLEPLLSDAVDFVRQGALIANALVLMQQPESKVLACSLQPSAVATA